MNRRAIILLIGILIVAAFMRLYNITSIPPGLYPDEAMNGNNALEAIATGQYKVFYPENNGREGLFINIQSFSLRVFGNQPWALRVVSALFGILTVLGIYLLTKELFNFGLRGTDYGNRVYSQFKIHNSQSIALLASFLMATSFWHINFSRIGFRAITAPFWLAWGLYLMLATFRKAEEGGRKKEESVLSMRPTMRNTKYAILALLGGIVYGLGFHSYIAYRATPLIVFYVLWRCWRASRRDGWHKQFYLSSFLFLLSSFLVVLPLLFYFISHEGSFFGRTTQVSVFSSPAPIENLIVNTVKTLGMFNFTGDWNWRHNYSGKPELSLPVGVMFLIGIAVGISAILNKNAAISCFLSFTRTRDSRNDPMRLDAGSGSVITKSSFEMRHGISSFGFRILLLWFLAAMLPVVVSNEGIPHALRSILMLPPVMIFAAVGGVALYEFAKRHAPQTFVSGLAAIVIVVVLIDAYKSYFIKWARNPNVQGAFASDYVELGRELNRLSREAPVYVVVTAGGVDVRGIPMPAQTVMFITDTFTPDKQMKKNIYYVLPHQEENIPSTALRFNI